MKICSNENMILDKNYSILLFGCKYKLGEVVNELLDVIKQTNMILIWMQDEN